MTKLFIVDVGLITPAHRATLAAALPGVEIVCAQATPEQMADADFIFGNPAHALLAHCKKLRLLQLWSAGTHGYVEALPEGAVLANATGAYGLAISEHLLGMLLLLMKNFDGYYRNQQASLWKDQGAVTSVWGSTALIIGLGDIGGEFARRIKALGGTTIGVRRAGTDKPDYLDELYSTDALDDLLPRADFISLSLPSTPATYHIINRERLAMMKKGAILLNVGRGDAIDQDALCDALDSGHLKGAGLDVTDPEPLPAGHRLWSTRGVFLTPHISGGGHLPETINRIVAIAAQNVAAAEAGQPIRNFVDPATGYRRLP